MLLYTVYRYNSSITDINGSLFIVNTTWNTYQNDYLISSGIYYYAIIATNETGSSDLSNNANITLILPVPSEPVLDPLTSPGNGDVFLIFRFYCFYGKH